MQTFSLNPTSPRRMRVRILELRSPIVFDTDCISSFLWVRSIDLVVQTMADCALLVPSQVIAELGELMRFPDYRFVPQLMHDHIHRGHFQMMDTLAADAVADEYFRLTQASRKPRPLGPGEAAVLSYVRFQGGTVASNNLRDVRAYCERYYMGLITTADIMCHAVAQGMMTVAEGEYLWEGMKARRRRLPDGDFADALRRFQGV